MANQLNWRFLLKFGLATVVVLALVHGLHLLQKGRLMAHLKTQAESNAEAGNLDRSALYYSRYVAQRPEDVDATAAYGLVLYRQAKTNTQRWRAFMLLEDVLLRNPHMSNLRLPLAHLAVALNQYEKGVRFLEQLRDTVSERSELEQTIAWCYIGLRDNDRAEKALLKSIEFDRKRTEPYLLLADLYRRTNRESLANQTLHQMVEANPRSPTVLKVRADAYTRLNRLEEAAADLEAAIALAPTEVALRMQAAEVARLRERIDECREILEKALTALPQQPRLLQFRAWLEMDNERTAASKAILGQALERHPQDVELWALKAELAFDQNQTDEANQAVDVLRGLDANGLLTRYHSARQQAARGAWVSAARQLEAVVGDMQPAWQSRAWAALAQAYKMCGDDVRYVQARRRAVQNDPASRQARLTFARLCAERGDFDSARTQVEPIQKSPAPIPAAWPLLARILLGVNETTLALGGPKVNWEETEQALTKAQAVDACEALLLSARMWDLRADAKRADDLLKQARKNHTQEARVWLALVDRALADSDLATANSLLNEARKEVGYPAELRLARGRWLVLKTQLALAAQTTPGEQESLQTTLWRQLGDLWANTEDFPHADQAALFVGLAKLQSGSALDERKRLGEAWRTRLPYHLGGALVLYDLACAKKDEAGVEQRLGEMKQIEGDDGVYWRCAQALWLIQKAYHGDKAGLELAKRMLQEATGRQPQWARIALTKARLADVERRTGEALRLYQQAFDNGEREEWVTERLVRLLVEQGRSLDADRVLRLYQREQRPTPELARFGADIARQRGEWARARDLARLAVTDKNTDYRDHLWLAEIQELSGAREEAQRTLANLVQKAGDTPEVWVALIRHHVRGGQRDVAQGLLEEAKKKVAEEQHDWLLAQAFEELGDLKAAESAYEHAVQAAPGEAVLHERLARLYLYQDDPGRALPELQWLANPNNQVSRATLHWGRRTLALASVGLLGTEPSVHADSKQQQVALQLLDRNRSQPADELADRRARHFIEMLDPEKRKAALTAMNATQTQAPLTPDEQYRLALVLLGVFGETPRARQLLTSLTKTYERNGQYIAGYARLKIADKEKNEAREWLAQLIKVEPNSRRTEALKKQLGD